MKSFPRERRKTIKRQSREFGVPYLPGEWSLANWVAARSEKRLRAIATWRRRQG